MPVTCSARRSAPPGSWVSGSSRPAAPWTSGSHRGGLPPDFAVEDTGTALAETERAIDAHHDPAPGAMVRVSVAPCSPFAVTGDLLGGAAELARRRGVRLHTHGSETVEEEDYCAEKFGCTPTEFLDRYGWTGPDVWLAHCVHLDERAIRRLGETGTGVAHCPSSNGRLGTGIAPVPELLAAGAPVGLGVDGTSSNEARPAWTGGAGGAAVRPRAPRPGRVDRAPGAVRGDHGRGPLPRPRRTRSALSSRASWPTWPSGGSTAPCTRPSPTRSPRSPWAPSRR